MVSPTIPLKSHGLTPRMDPQDFAKLQLEEISQNISARRNKIFLLMEEVRRLRIQQRIKVTFINTETVYPSCLLG